MRLMGINDDVIIIHIPRIQHLCACRDKTAYVTLNEFRSNRADFSYVVSRKVGTLYGSFLQNLEIGQKVCAITAEFV